MEYFDFYSMTTAYKINVNVCDKSGLEELSDELAENDVDVSTKDYKKYSLSTLQEEFSYITDEIEALDDFDFAWVQLDDNTVELSIFYYDNEKDPIVTYTVSSVLESE